MKRIYSKPEMKVVQMRVRTTLMIGSDEPKSVRSVSSNGDFDYEGGRAHDSR